LVAVGFVTVWLTPEPKALSLPPLAGETAMQRIRNRLEDAVVAPFVDVLARPHWAAVLLFIVLYKYGDALAGLMSTPLYVDLSFTVDEVANISKIFGVGATLVGVAVGGLIVARFGLYPSLLFCGVV